MPGRHHDRPGPARHIGITGPVMGYYHRDYFGPGLPGPGPSPRSPPTWMIPVTADKWRGSTYGPSTQAAYWSSLPDILQATTSAAGEATGTRFKNTTTANVSTRPNTVIAVGRTYKARDRPAAPVPEHRAAREPGHGGRPRRAEHRSAPAARHLPLPRMVAAHHQRPSHVSDGPVVFVGAFIFWCGRCGGRRSAVLLWPDSPHLAGHRQLAAQPVRRLTGAARTSTRPGRHPHLQPARTTLVRTGATGACTATANRRTASCSCCLALGPVTTAGRGDLGYELADSAPGQAEPLGSGPAGSAANRRRPTPRRPRTACSTSPGTSGPLVAAPSARARLTCYIAISTESMNATAGQAKISAPRRPYSAP